jgi:hypothetical protein
MIIIKYYLSILAVAVIAATLALSPFTTMTALAAKTEGSNIHNTNNKHFDAGKQITSSVDRHFNNNNNNNDDNNFKFKHDDNNFKFKHDDNNFKFKHDDNNFKFNNHNHNNDNVKVVHKTVVVHDRDNNEKTIVINTNLAGTCFVTQSQIVNIPGIVAQLLGQCISVTIIQG